MNKYKLHLLALQETKLKKTGISEYNKYVLFNSGGANRLLGTGFLVNKELRETVVEFKPFSERICWLQLKRKYRKVSLVNIHAPSEEKDIAIKMEF